MLSFDKLFGNLFESLEAKLQQLESVSDIYYKSTISQTERLTSAQKELISALQAQQQILNSLNTKQANSASELSKYAEELKKASDRLNELRNSANQIDVSIDANTIAIKDLRTILSMLRTDYEKLDPTQNDFSAKQKEIASRAKSVKEAIDAQLNTLKGATKVIKTTENSYNELSKQTNELRNRLKNLPDAFDKVTGAINKHNKEAVLLQSQIQANDKALKGADANMGVYSRNVGNYSGALGGFGKNLLMFSGILFGIDSAITAVQKTFEVVTSFDRYNSVIKFASANTKEFDGNLQFLQTLADKTGTDIELLYQKFGAFSVGAKEAGFSLNETKKVFQSIVLAGGALKMSNEAVDRSLKAISDAVAKGSIQMEELKGQLGDHLPGALALFSKGLNVSTEELIKMMKEGVVMSKDTLPKFAEQLEKTFGAEASNNVNTMTGSFNRMTNQIKLLVYEFSQKTGIDLFFSNIMNGIANWAIGIRELTKEYGALKTIFYSINIGGVAGIGARRVNEDRIKSEFTGSNSSMRLARLQVTQDEIKVLEKRLVLNDREQEQLKTLKDRLSTLTDEHKKLLRAKREESGIELPTKGNIKSYDELSKAISAVETKLRDGLVGKTLSGTDEASLRKQLASLSAQKKAIDDTTKAIEGKGKKAKEADTELEKLVKTLNKVRDTLADEVLSDMKRNGIVDLDPTAIKRFNEMYLELQKVSKVIGVDIPANLIQMYNVFNKVLPSTIDKLKGVGVSNLNTNTATTDYQMSNSMADTLSPYSAKNIAEQEALRARISKRSSGLNTNEINPTIELLKNQQRAEDEINRLSLEEKKKLSLSKGEEERRLIREEFAMKKQMAKDEVELNKNKIDEILSKEALAKEKRQLIISQVAEFTNMATQGVFEIGTALRDRDLSRLEKAKAKELELAGDNAEAKALIEKKYTEESNKIKLKQAKADRAMALFNIAINTAVAAAKVWGQTGIGGIAAQWIPIAMGAAQAALVMAKPLPEYAVGTKNAPETMALVGEKGAELRESRGKYYYYDKPTVTQLRSGDVVYTAKETEELLNKSANQSYILASTNRMKQANNTLYEAKMNDMRHIRVETKDNSGKIVDGFKEALKEQPYVTRELKHGEIVEVVHTSSSIVEYRNKRYS